MGSYDWPWPPPKETLEMRKSSALFHKVENFKNEYLSQT